MRFILIILATIPPISGGWKAYAGDANKGRAIAEAHCTRCHIVGDFNPYGGISSTPSFQLMVNALDDYQERFDSFFSRPPHPAVIIIEGVKKNDDLPYNASPVTITVADIENIAAFANTLKK